MLQSDYYVLEIKERVRGMIQIPLIRLSVDLEELTLQITLSWECRPIVIQLQQLKYLSMKTESQETKTSNKRQYTHIPLKKKIQLIKLVFRRKKSLDDTIKELGFKKTTAVNILNRFKETGELPFRKFKKQRPLFQKKGVSLKLEEMFSQEQKGHNEVKNEPTGAKQSENQSYRQEDVIKEEENSSVELYRFF